MPLHRVTAFIGAFGPSACISSALTITAALNFDWDAQLSDEEATFAERLAGWQERYPEVGIHRHIEIGEPARWLIDGSKRAQLIVVGSHGRGGFAGMLLGSVRAAVIHRAGIPVIVARQS